VSHNAHAAPAKFKINFDGLWDVEVVRENDPRIKEDLEILPSKHGGRKIPEPLRKVVQSTVLLDCYVVNPDPVKGWKAVKGDLEKTHGKKFDSIIAHRLVKDKHEVWYVNESQYSNVGCETPAFIAFDKASIEAFQKDFGGRLEEDTVVNSSW
jgi:hypothetical protein